MRLFLLIVTMLSIGCNKNQTPTEMPQPFETFVKADMEDYHHKTARNAWFELLHTAAPGVDWKEVERQNMMKTFAERQQIKQEVQLRNGEVSIADGKIEGTWKERGSNNQAGSVSATVFDNTTDILYCVSAGGTLWKGGIDGLSWEPINQDVQFDDRFLVLTSDSLGNNRLIASISQLPYYSDDEGFTWTQVDGFSTPNNAELKLPILMESTGEIFCLFKSSSNSSFKLMYSDDGGLSFRSKGNFNTGDSRNLHITKMHHSDNLFVIEQLGVNRSKLHQWNNESKTLEILKDETPIGFGQQGRANLVSSIQDDVLRFVSYNGDNIVHISYDTAKSWTVLDTLEERPWEVGLRISKHDPNHLQVGGVESFRSYDSGTTWNKVNTWGAYYGDPEHKLHADIMYYEEFTTSDGKPFVLNCNHGGMYISYNNGLNYDNISLSGLNIAQYYSVRTSPVNPYNVWAGSQDQGFQRGIIDFDGDEVANFDQVISGDYGHIVFTNYGESLWTVYPGGWIIYYPEPITGSHQAAYTIDSNEETVWIPPLIAHPDPSKNIIYAAGGNKDGGNGSHIIQLEYVNGEIIASQFDQDFSETGGTIAAMAVDPFNHDRWFVTTTDRKYYKSEDGGETFQKFAITIPGDHYLYGAHIVPSKDNPDVVYMAGSGYSNPPVLKSVDGGKAWSNMAIGLPPTTVLDIAVGEDDKYLYAATEAGPYIYITEDKLWYPLGGTVAPVQTYWSVEIVPYTQIARFGTYGRGIWDFEITSQPVVSSTEQSELNIDFEVYPNPSSQLINIKLEETTQLDRVTILGLDGRVIYQAEDYLSSRPIDISQYQSGNYILNVNFKNNIISKQFTKQ